MIIKAQDVTGEALAKLIKFIHSDANIVRIEYNPDVQIVSIKHVNSAAPHPGLEPCYSVDLDVVDCYNSGSRSVGVIRTDPKYLLRAYKILVGR